MSRVANARKAAMIAQHINSPQGRAVIAASMQQPLRERRDYASIGRKTFHVDELPPGALPYYDKDAEVQAYVVGEEGQSIVSILKSKRVMFPIFEIASNPEIPITQIYQRRYDMVERAQEQARSMIQAAEDERVFAVMDAVATNGYDSVAAINTDIPVIAPISGAIIADAFALIERHDLRVARIYMNSTDYADIRKFGRDILDPESQQTLLKTGLQGTIYGAKVVMSRIVPAGTVYLCCEPIMFGRIPVQIPLTVISADKPSERKIGFSVYESLGIGAFNPRGLARLTVSRG